MYVAGIDAHSSYVVVAIVSKDGELAERLQRIRSDHPDRLIELLSKYHPLDVVVETSSAWPWLYDLLTPRGVRFVLAHAKRLRAIAESTYKADEVDAELLARMHLAGLIPAVHVKPVEQREWSRLVRHRKSLVQKRTALVNQIHGQLHQVGLRIARGRLLTRPGVRWLRKEAWTKLGREQRRLVRTHLQLIATLRPMVRGLDRHIEEVTAEIPAARLLRSVPGIGAYRSLVIVAETLPIDRFPKPADLVSYCGLAPVTRSSGGRTRHGSLPRGANRWLRGALVTAVVSHVQHSPESWLSQYYASQKARLGWQVARVATARKLCRALHAMLRTGTVWQNNVAEPERGELLESHAAETAAFL
jgi:transposase